MNDAIPETIDGDPVVTIHGREGASVLVRCPHCGGTHRHGAASDFSYPEQRVAECLTGNGYYVVDSDRYDPEKTAEIYGDVLEETE